MINRLYNIKEVMAIIPMSRKALTRACMRGEISNVKIGRRVFVPGWYIARLVNEPETTIKTK